MVCASQRARVGVRVCVCFAYTRVCTPGLGPIIRCACECAWRHVCLRVSAWGVTCFAEHFRTAG